MAGSSEQSNKLPDTIRFDELLDCHIFRKDVSIKEDENLCNYNSYHEV